MADQDKYTIEQFAQKIKEKYPQYKDMEDDDLVTKIITKYPEYESSIIKKKDEFSQEDQSLVQDGQEPSTGLEQPPLQSELPNIPTPTGDLTTAQDVTQIQEPIISDQPVQPEGDLTQQDLIDIESESRSLKAYLNKNQVSLSQLGLPEDMNVQKLLEDSDIEEMNIRVQKAKEPDYYYNSKGEQVPMNASTRNYVEGLASGISGGIGSIFRTIDKFSPITAASKGVEQKQKEKREKELSKPENEARKIWEGIHDEKQETRERSLAGVIASKYEGISEGFQVPDDFLGRTLEGLGAISADIATTAFMPEMNLPKYLKVVPGINKIGKFPLLLGTKEAAHGETLKEIGEGFVQGNLDGYLYEGMGMTGHEFGKLFSAVKGGKVLTPAMSAHATGTLFMGEAALKEYMETGQVTPENVQSAYGMGIGMGLKAVAEGGAAEIKQAIGKSVRNKANTAFYTAHPDIIKAVAKMDINPSELRKQSNELAEKIGKEKDAGVKTDMQNAKNVIDNTLFINGMINAISKNPTEFIKNIDNDPKLNPEEKALYKEKINEAVLSGDKNLAEGKKIQDEITGLKEQKKYWDDKKDEVGEELIKAKTKDIGEKIKAKEEDLTKIFEEKKEPVNKSKEAKPKKEPKKKEIKQPEKVEPEKKPEVINKEDKVINIPKEEKVAEKLKTEGEVINQKSELEKEKITGSKEIKPIKEEIKDVVQEEKLTQEVKSEEKVEPKEIKSEKPIEEEKIKVSEKPLVKPSEVEILQEKINEENDPVRLEELRKKLRKAEKIERADIMIAEGVDELASALNIKKGIIADGNPLNTPRVYDAVMKIAEGYARKAGVKIEDVIDHLKKTLAEYKITGEHLDEYRDRILTDIETSGELDLFDTEIKETELSQDEITKEVKAKEKELKQKQVEDKKKSRDEVRDFIFNRRTELSLNTFETNLFVDGIDRTKIGGKKMTKEQKETIPFIIEKTDIPNELERPELQKELEKNKDELTEVANKVKKHFDEKWDYIVENTDKFTADQIEDYVTHIWDIPANKKADVVNWFAQKNKFLNKRYIETYAEGIKLFGLKPKTLDITEIIKIHDSMAHNVVENNKFVEEIKGLKRDGINLVQREDKAPSDWVDINHPAMETKTMVDNKIIPMSLKVHPDLVNPINVIFGKNIKWKARVAGKDVDLIKAWEQIGGVMKKTQLSLSLFHHGALTETAVAFMGLPKTMVALGNIAKQYLIGGKTPTMFKEGIARDAIKSGVQFGSTIDIPIKAIQGMVDKMASKTKKIPGVHQALKGFASFNKKWDQGLWDYLHDGLKLYGYEHAVATMPKSVKTQAEITRYKREQAALINDTFGGQNFDVLMKDPKTTQIMKWFLLSPDWTLSTLRQAMSPTGLGAMYKEGRKYRRKTGTMFWLKAGLYFGVGMNLLNIYQRKKDEEENPDQYSKDMKFMDYTMFNNTIGHKTHLFHGRYEDGHERYIRWGKQFRELPELLMDDEGVSLGRPALKKIGGKAAPQLQVVSQLMTGKSLSGYENWDMKNKKGLEWTVAALKMMGKSVLPFSWSSMLRDDKEWNPADLAMPSSKGMSKSDAIHLFKKGILANDEGYIKEIYTYAIRNKLDAYDAFKTALTVTKSDGTRELMEGVNTIDDVKAKLKEDLTSTEKQKLKRKKKRLEEEQKHIKQGIELWEDVLDMLNDREKSSSKSKSNLKKTKFPGSSSSGLKKTKFPK